MAEFSRRVTVQVIKDVGDDTTVVLSHTSGGVVTERVLRYGVTDRATHTNNGYTPSGMDEFAPRDQQGSGEGAAAES